MGMSVLESDDLTDLNLCQLLGVAVRSTGKFGHAAQAVLQKALFPLIPRLGANRIFLTQLSKVLGVTRFQYKLYSLVHRLYFFPWHPVRLSNFGCRVLP